MAPSRRRARPSARRCSPTSCRGPIDRSSWCWPVARTRRASRVCALRFDWPGSPAGSRGAGSGASAGRSTAMPMSMSTTGRCGRRPASSSWPSIPTRSSSATGRSPTPTSAALEADVRRDWTVEADVAEAESLDRSLRAALALEAVVDAHGLDGGAFNCHVPQFRFGEPIGIAPCWGLGRLTSGGRPFTCTGDIVTAVAMLTTKRLGGAAVYHEIEAIDYATGEVVIANSGEHDLAWLARRRAAQAPAQRLVLRQGPALRGVRGLRARSGAGHAGRVHAASTLARRLSLRRRARRADRAAVPRDGHRQRRLPVRGRTGRGGLGPLGERRGQSPQLRDARATWPRTSSRSPGTSGIDAVVV